MHIDELRAYCLAKKCATEDFPFDVDTLVFKVVGKMFALIPLEKWESGHKTIHLKCDPEYALELRATYESIYSGYHMNKKHWNTVELSSGTLDAPFIKELIDHSYAMVVQQLPKYKRPE